MGGWDRRQLGEQVGVYSNIRFRTNKNPNMNRLESLSASELLALFNKVSGENVKRFADRKSGLRRLQKLAADPAKRDQITAHLNLGQTKITVIDRDKPLPTLEETLRAGADERARKAGLPTLSDPPKPTPRRKAGKKRKPAAAATPQTLIRPIEGSKLVSAGGRVVRPENAEKVLAGKALWGAVGDAPSDKDRLKGENSRLNLNYPAKKSIKPMREGTKRHKLVAIMRSKGVTIEDVMAMFQLTHDQAVYKLRDLNYMCGHGLEVRNGRVFVTDK